MQDRLEEFVKANRDAFDDATPDAKLWAGIEGALNEEEKVKPIKSNLWIWKAAVVLLLGAVTFLMVDRYLPRETPADQMISSLEEFRDLEAFYTSIINEKSDKLSVELEGEEFFNYLEADIEELDAIYKELRESYATEMKSELVMGRLIHLLRQKLHLINSQLDILEEAKKPVSTEDETTAI